MAAINHRLFQRAQRPVLRISSNGAELAGTALVIAAS